ncbi:MAG: TonB-dependent receptor [Prevotella sp.]|nr:TonB-dependent receptor [Prevotella sp.]
MSEVKAEGTMEKPDMGSIRGRIVNEDNEILPGATIFIEELHTGVTSDVNGFYNLSNLKPGTYNLQIKYIGYSPVKTRITIKSNTAIEKIFKLEAGLELQEVQVNGAFQGQRKALSMQQNAMGISNVVSADQVGKFPDSNIGDALKRINGVNVQYDQGEARFGQVRGTSADLTSVTINGNRIPSAEGETRNVQLDLIPADMIQMVELNKVVTSDMDGDAIGGEINLVTKNTPYKPVFNITAGGGTNAVSGKMNKNLGLTFGRRLFDDKFGIMLAASYQYNPVGSDNTEFKYDVDKKGTVFLDKAEIRQYYVTRERQSYSLALDYKFNVNHKIGFKGIYNRRSDWENRFRITSKKIGSDPTKQSLVLQTKAGDSSNKDARLELQQTMDFTLDGEHHFGNLKMDWAGSYSRATEDRPEERYLGVVMKGKKNAEFFENLTWIDKGQKQPYPSIMLTSVDDHKWSIDEMSNSNQNIYENEWKGRLNFELPISRGLYGSTLKWGGKFTSKTKDKDKHCISYAESYEDTMGEDWKNNMSGQIRNGFMPGSMYPTNVPFVNKSYLGSFDYSNLTGTEDNSEAAGNFHANERITAAYLRLDQRLGKSLDMTLGLRMENTYCKYRGYNWIVNDADDENGKLVETDTKSKSYTNWLPSMLLRYTPKEDLRLRLSYTQTLARPKYSALIPNISYNVADEEATFGNPNLKPTTSHNLDISAEYYFKSIGLVSAGVFYKRLKDVIVTEVWKTSSDPNIPSGLLNGDGDIANYEASKPINAYDADIFGIELAYQRDFGFICPALNCIGFYGTYTYTHSKTCNHNFEHRSADNTDEVKMMGSPEHTANMSLYFEKKGINVRLSWNTASSFLDELGTTASLDRYYDSVNYLDLNASYTWGKKMKTTIYADATNLLNQPLRYYQGEKDRTMQVEYYGVKFNAGVKISF